MLSNPKVPPDMSRRLYEAAPGRDKRWLAFPNADHNDAELGAGERMVEEIAELIIRHEQGAVVKLGEVASVGWGHKERE